jgi:type IX secretion system PorP/SprF family membrane protein
MKRYLTIALFWLVTYGSYGQQDPLYSQYLNNPIVLNPAYAGINNVFSASLAYRTQWTGLDGAPKTALLSASSSFFDNKVGGGLTIINDKIGSVTNTQINISGAYKIEFGDNTFSFGMQTGINTYRENNDELDIRDPNDALFSSNQSFTKINIGAGAIIKGPQYFIGLSVPRLINSTENIDNVETQIYSRHYYLGLGYVFLLNNSLALKTGTLIKAVAEAPASIDLSASLLFLDRFNAGLMSRNLETYGLTFGMLLKENLRFGYTFEVPTNQSVGSQFSSHELTLTLDLELLDGHFIKERYF